MSGGAASLTSLFARVPLLVAHHLLVCLSARDQVHLTNTHQLAHRYLCPAADGHQVLPLMRWLRAEVSSVLTAAPCCPSVATEGSSASDDPAWWHLPGAAVQQAFWRRGPGWRICHLHDVQPGEEYYIFAAGPTELAWVGRGGQQPQLMLLPAKLVRALRSAADETSAVDAASSSLSSIAASSLSSLASPSPSSSALSVASLQTEADAALGGDDTHGAGPAADIPATRAVPGPATNLDAPHMASVISPLLSTWSVTQLRCFQHAAAQLTAVAQQLSQQRACAYLRFAPGDHSGDFDDLTQHCMTYPTPFLLPWPVAGGAGDTRHIDMDTGSGAARPRCTQLVYHNQTSSAWQNDPMESDPDVSICACPFERSDADALNSDDGAYRHNTDVSHLSSVVRGCPWPLTYVDEGSGRWDGIVEKRENGECNLVARRVGAMLGLAPQLRAACWGRDYQPGVRPRNQQEAQQDFLSDQAKGLPREAPVVGPFMVDLFTSGASDEDQWRATLDELSHVLRGSLIVELGTENICPWPTAIVAPLAPGWIGGFMAGGAIEM